MILIDYAPPKRVSRREVYDESHAYSTVPGEAGRSELIAIARRVGIHPRRVHLLEGRIACLLVASHEVHQLQEGGARIATDDEIRALYEPPARPDVAHCETHGDYDGLMSPDGCPDCAEESFRALQERSRTHPSPAPSLEEQGRIRDQWNGRRWQFRSRGIRPGLCAPEPRRTT